MGPVDPVDPVTFTIYLLDLGSCRCAARCKFNPECLAPRKVGNWARGGGGCSCEVCAAALGRGKPPIPEGLSQA